MKAPVPAAGWVFVVLVVLAPVLLVIGMWLGVKAVLFAGAVALGFLVLFLLLGMIC